MLKQFIEEISQSNIIYALKKEEEIASVESLYEDDDNGEPIEAMCIWSKKDLAKKNIEEEWQDYTLVEIPVNSFLGDWCIGLFNDGLVFCLNLNSEESEPIECEPLDIAYAIANQFIKNNIKTEIENYKNIQDYLAAIEPFIITRQDNDIN